VCGKDVHRRRITGVHIDLAPEKFLGRPLSPQGIADLNLTVHKACIVVELGDEVYEEEES